MQQESASSDEVDVAALVRVVWRRKAWIAVATLLMTMAAIGYALIATEWYRAEAVLMPRDEGASGGLSGQLAQLGGFASMAGISLGQTPKQEPLGVLRSLGFARRFVERNDLVSVFSDEIPQTPSGSSDTPDRSLQKATEIFRKSVFTVVEDKKSGLIIVAIEWKDPVLAAKWANAVPRQLNEEMRQRALRESTRNLQYLRDQLARTETVSLQQAIARLIETEMQNLMLAEGTDQYALRVIDDAQPPSRRSRPKRATLILVAFMGGLFASVLVAAVFDPWKAFVREIRAG